MKIFVLLAFSLIMHVCGYSIEKNPMPLQGRVLQQQRYRASGLNLVTAAIVLWNTVYLERATKILRAQIRPWDDTLLQYLSPLGWEHINLAGDYHWRRSTKIGAGKFRRLRPLPKP